jgi:hypothetical protein
VPLSSIKTVEICSLSVAILYLLKASRCMTCIQQKIFSNHVCSLIKKKVFNRTSLNYRTVNPSAFKSYDWIPITPMTDDWNVYFWTHFLTVFNCIGIICLFSCREKRAIFQKKLNCLNFSHINCTVLLRAYRAQLILKQSFLLYSTYIHDKGNLFLD